MTKQSEIFVQFKELAARITKDKRWMTILILGLIALILISILLFGPKLKEEDKDNRGLQAIQSFDLQGSVPGNTYTLGENFLILRPEQVTLQDYRGQQLSSIPLDFQLAVAIRDQDRVLCGDRQSTRVIQFDRNGALSETQLEGGLAGASFNGSSIWAVIDEIPDKHPIVHLLNEDGSRIATLTFDLSGSPIRVAFTPDGKMLDVLILDSKGSRLKTVMKRFDLQGNQVAQRILEGYDGLFWNITHDSQGNPVVHSTSTVIRFHYDDEESLKNYDFAFIAAVYPHGEELTILAGGQQDSALTAYELMKDGTLENSESSFQSIDFSVQSGDSLLIASGANLYRYLQNQRKTDVLGMLDGKIMDMEALSGNRLAVVTNRAASILQLP